MSVSTLFSVAVLASQAALVDGACNCHSAELTINGDCVIDGTATVRCDQLGRKLVDVDGKSDAWVSLLIDNAKYETVIRTIRSLQKEGLTDLSFVAIGGSKPPDSASRWIKFQVVGNSNHPFAMVMISTEHFRTWGMDLVVLSRRRFEALRRFTMVKMSQPDCQDLNERYDNTIGISEHDNHRDKFCVIPKAASCDFLSAVIQLPEIRWSDSELKPIAAVRSELACRTNRASN